MCELADSSDRPQSQLTTALAALSHLYDGMGMNDITKLDSVRILCSALIKSSTKSPMQKSSVMPIQPFYAMFEAWPENEHLALEKLRMKCICLLALLFMCRPSDLAPKGVIFDPLMLQGRSRILSTQNVRFPADGGVTIEFLGIKNDTSRQGFVVTIPGSVIHKVDAASALKTYITRTAAVRTTPEQPLFLTLKKPYSALTAGSIASVLNKSIELAGLDRSVYSAKSFRPTGATVAIDNGVDSDVARRIGRWKTASVFLDHYVHSRVSPSYVSDVFEHD